MAADDDGLEAGFGGEGGEEASVAFANGEAGGECIGGGGGLDSIVEEGDDVVADVVVEPGEYYAGSVG